MVSFCVLKAELQAAGQVCVQATANVGGKAVPKAGIQEAAKAGLNTVRDLVNKKGADAAKFLRAKADELDEICSVF